MVAALFIPAKILAAEIKLETSTKDEFPGQIVEIKVLLNTREENINAVAGEIILPASFFSLKEINDGNSLVNFWVEHPKLETGNKISFAGIIPGGYTGRGQLFSFKGELRSAGIATFTISTGKALLNDGAGSPASFSAVNLSLSILKPSEKTPVTEQKILLPKTSDTMPPESFLPLIGNESSIFNGQWFLVFVTQDKDSGIDHYEVREGNNSFVVAESPYLLRDQKLKSKIYIKAIDRAGNERLEILSSQNRVWYESFWFYGIIILVFIILLLGKKLWRKKRQK